MVVKKDKFGNLISTKDNKFMDLINAPNPLEAAAKAAAIAKEPPKPTAPPTPTPRTPVEIASAQQAGDEFIRRREQIASGLIDNGFAPKKALQAATAQIAGINPQVSMEQSQQVLKERQRATQNIQGEIPQLTPDIKVAGVNEVLGEVMPGSVGVGAGAGASAAILGTAATGVGAVALAAASAYAATKIVSELKSKRGVQINIEKQSAKDSIKNLKGVINYAKDPLSDPLLAVQLYNEEIAKLAQAESNLKLLEEAKWGDVSAKWLEDIEAFRRVKFLYDQQLADAIAKNSNSNYDYEFSGFSEDLAQ